MSRAPTHPYEIYQEKVKNRYPFLFTPNHEPVLKALNTFLIHQDHDVATWFLHLPKNDEWFDVVQSIFIQSNNEYGKYQHFILDCIENTTDPIKTMKRLL